MKGWVWHVREWQGEIEGFVGSEMESIWGTLF